MLTDGPAGVRINPTRKGTTQTFYATGFPIGSCLASSWDQELLRRVGVAIGEETMEYGCDVILGPGLNLHRNPLCGRNFEYFSEDPLVTGKMAAAYINGVQSKGVGTSAKHYAVNSQETDRTSVDERLSARAARELYLRGFEIAVREGKPWTIMSSYNLVNGQFSMGNHDLLTKVLRDDWGYDGIVMTDWIGIRKGLRTIDEVMAGNDLMEPGKQEQIDEIVAGVKDGTLDIKYVDRNVRRMLEYIVKTPSFRKYPYTNAPDLKAHAQITRQAATEGMVLLKNNGTLPWTTGDNGERRTERYDDSQGSGAGLNGNHTAHFSPLTSHLVDTVALFGVTSYHFLSGGTGSGCVHTPYIINMVDGLKNAGICTSKTLTDLYQKYVEFAALKFEADRDPAKWFQRAEFGDQKYPEMEVSQRCIVNEVDKSDAAIITIGRQAGEGLDRDIKREFNLTADERQMIYEVCNAFHAKGKPVVVIINSGSVVETASWSQYPDAILVAWQPGEEGGNSVADILTGKVNPSGKLTMTWPLAAADHPSTKDFPLGMPLYNYVETQGESKRAVRNYDYTRHNEDIYVGYRYFDSFKQAVAYPFGFGMSYTTFGYSNLKVKELKGGTISVSVTVKNTGSVAGKEIAQVYVAAPQGRLEKPVQELKAFGKTRELKPGESQTLTMTMQKRDLASFDEPGSQWIVEGGNYTVKVGASSRDIRLSVPLRLTEYTEKTSNALAPKVKLNTLKRFN